MSDNPAPPNPPAFPMRGLPTNWATTKQDGMTLRDYFAAKALPVILGHSIKSGGKAMGLAAGVAYEVADQMLAERAKAP